VLHVVPAGIWIQGVYPQALLDAAARVLRLAGFKVHIKVWEGEPIAVIVESAREWDADLIVLGSHGRTMLHRLLCGSMADSVAHHAPCSVELVRVHPESRVKAA